MITATGEEEGADVSYTSPSLFGCRGRDSKFMLQPELCMYKTPVGEWLHDAAAISYGHPQQLYVCRTEACVYGISRRCGPNCHLHVPSEIRETHPIGTSNVTEIDGLLMALGATN